MFIFLLLVGLFVFWCLAWFFIGIFAGFVKWVFFTGPYASFGKRSAEVVEPEEIGSSND